MNYSTLISGLKDNTVNVLTCGHRSFPLLEYAERQFNHIQKMIKEHTNGIVNNTPTRSGVTHESMLEFYNKLLVIEHGSYFGDPFSLPCFSCDQEMYLVSLDENNVAYVPKQYYWTIAKNSPEKYKHVFNMVDLNNNICEAGPLIEAKKMVTQISIPTGKLVFDNFFRNEELYDFPKETRYSKPDINSILGRNRLMQHLAQKDVGCAQMSNTSITIFAKDDGTKIIIGSDYLWDGKKEESVSHKGYTKIGRIILDVWRWMCADKSVLDQYNEKIGDRAIIADVKSGKWQIDHYYDFIDDRDEVIYSTLSLVGE